MRIIIEDWAMCVPNKLMNFTQYFCSIGEIYVSMMITR